ncbi:MAG: bifunctional pyr operon transcriptional regulator/uracil phosphoribosyltransferase PyrR [Actinomycetes bacterium]
MNPPAAHRETRILDGADIRRAVTRISHEIVERNQGAGALVVVGVQTGGVWIAEQIAANISAIEPAREVALGTVDVSMYRDDLALRPVVPAAPTRIPCDLTGATVVLVDNVLYTGRTVRAALEALNDHGRPRAVQLAVIVDRGHRELPIRPDYVGKNVPTHMADDVTVGPDGVVITTTMEATA